MPRAVSGTYPIFILDTVGSYVAIAAYYDPDTEDQFCLLKETDEDDVMWQFMKAIADIRNRRTKALDIYTPSFPGRPFRLILQTMLEHDIAPVMGHGLTDIMWNISKGKNINFKDAGLFSMWDSLSQAAREIMPFEPNDCWSELDDPISRIRHRAIERCRKISEIMSYHYSHVKEKTNVNPSPGIPSSSIRIAEAHILRPLKYIHYDEKTAPQIRAATYGGRNEVYTRYGENIIEYDFHSHFLSCYDVELPIGAMWPAGKMSIDKETAIMAQAKVKVPLDWYIGPLPYRDVGDDGREHVIFPVGEFEGIWDMQELQYAASKGVDITFQEQWNARTEPVLVPFRSLLLKLIETDTGWRGMWKKYGVTFQGKQQQKLINTVFSHIDNLESTTGWTYIEPTEQILMREEERKVPPNIRPLIPMRIQAKARVKHNLMLDLALQRGKIFYCDTDSVFTTATLPNHNPPEPGTLSNVATLDRGYFIRQKCYCLVHSDGHITTRVSSFSDTKLTEKDFTKLLDGKEVMARDIMRYRHLETALRNGNPLAEGLITRHPLRGTFPHTRVYTEDDSEPIILPRR